MKPELLSTAERIAEIRDNVKIAVVDASDEKKLTERYNILRFINKQ